MKYLKKIKHLQLATLNHLLQHKAEAFRNILLQHMKHPDQK
jgi:hypothetical protein